MDWESRPVDHDSDPYPPRKSADFAAIESAKSDHSKSALSAQPHGSPIPTVPANAGRRSPPQPTVNGLGQPPRVGPAGRLPASPSAGRRPDLCWQFEHYYSVGGIITACMPAGCYSVREPGLWEGSKSRIHSSIFSAEHDYRFNIVIMYSILYSRLHHHAVLCSSSRVTRAAVAKRASGVCSLLFPPGCHSCSSIHLCEHQNVLKYHRKFLLEYLDPIL